MVDQARHAAPAALTIEYVRFRRRARRTSLHDEPAVGAPEVHWPLLLRYSCLVGGLIVYALTRPGRLRALSVAPYTQRCLVCSWSR